MEQFLLKAPSYLKLEVIITVFCLCMILLIVKWTFSVFNAHISVLNELKTEILLHRDRSMDFQKNVQEQHGKMIQGLECINSSLCLYTKEFQLEIKDQNRRLDSIVDKIGG